ncbi:hypothetical protein FACS1894211_11890 [Clostridia bacterium]|nr:hypothetical protein FACS1894211_11890 [Clostridia bacterium]
MECPVCGAGPVKVLSERDGVKEIKCPCCRYTGEAADKPIAPVRQGVSSGEAVFEKNENAVIAFRAAAGGAQWSGSGFLIDRAGGYALTNAHVALGGDGQAPDAMSALIAGENVPARVVCAGDMRTGADLAVVQLERLPARAADSRLGDSDGLKNGAAVFVIGNSKGEGTRISGGFVGDKGRVIDGAVRILTDAAVNPGNSGGPMYDAEGRAVGVVVSKRNEAEAMGYAIPINFAKDFIRAAERKMGIGIRFRE